MRAQPRRQLLTDKASILFIKYGYHATGINQILKESGVSKATLYKYFGSKEVLILEVLKQSHLQQNKLIGDYFINAPVKKESVLLVFDVFDDWFNSKNFFGCHFLTAGVEYSQDDSIIHQYCKYHKESFKLYLEEFLIKVNQNKDENTAIIDSLILLIDGAIIAAHIYGDKQSAIKAKAIAIKLLKP